MGTEMFKDVCSQYFTKSWYTEIYMDIHIWGLQRMGPKRWVHSGSDYLVDARGHRRGMEKLISECSAAENHTGSRASPKLNHQRSDGGLLVWRVSIPAVTFSINNSGCCWRNAWRDIVSTHCWPFSTNWATLRYNSVLTVWDHSWPSSDALLQWSDMPCHKASILNTYWTLTQVTAARSQSIRDGLLCDGMADWHQATWQSPTSFAIQSRLYGPKSLRNLSNRW